VKIKLTDVRIQLAIGGLAFFSGLADLLLSGGDSMSDMSIFGKTCVVIVGLIIAWFAVRVLIIGLIFRK
jgi:hypothetical protein